VTERRRGSGGCELDSSVHAQCCALGVFWRGRMEFEAVFGEPSFEPGGVVDGHEGAPDFLEAFAAGEVDGFLEEEGADVLAAAVFLDDDVIEHDAVGGDNAIGGADDDAGELGEDDDFAGGIAGVAEAEVVDVESGHGERIRGKGSMINGVSL
jgi:hypothetical protein